MVQGWHRQDRWPDAVPPLGDCHLPAVEVKVIHDIREQHPLRQIGRGDTVSYLSYREILWIAQDHGETGDTTLAIGRLLNELHDCSTSLT